MNPPTATLQPRQPWRRLLARTSLMLLVLMLTVSPVPTASSGEGDGASDSPTVQPNSQVVEGWVLFPMHQHVRLYTSATLEGITHERIDPVLAGSPFSLKAAFGSEAGSCIVLACVETSDFDIVFLKDHEDGSTTLLQRYANVGTETGVVPSEATSAIIYLTTPGVVPELKGYRFAYEEMR